jgi:hypothetical protein
MKSAEKWVEEITFEFFGYKHALDGDLEILIPIVEKIQQEQRNDIKEYLTKAINELEWCGVGDGDFIDRADVINAIANILL